MYEHLSLLLIRQPSGDISNTRIQYARVEDAHGRASKGVRERDEGENGGREQECECPGWIRYDIVVRTLTKFGMTPSYNLVP